MLRGGPFRPPPPSLFRVKARAVIIGALFPEYLSYSTCRYVQGGLNPGKNPVPDGNLNITSFLPDGSYDVRYLVNSNYVKVVSKCKSIFLFEVSMQKVAIHTY